jgi:hypothetical protein
MAVTILVTPTEIERWCQPTLLEVGKRTPKAMAIELKSLP